MKNLNEFIEMAAKAFGTTPKMVLSESQKRVHAMPRHMAIYYATTSLKMKECDIAVAFNRKHSTIYASVKKSTWLLESDKLFASTYITLSEEAYPEKVVREREVNEHAVTLASIIFKRPRILDNHGYYDKRIDEQLVAVIINNYLKQIL